MLLSQGPWRWVAERGLRTCRGDGPPRGGRGQLQASLGSSAPPSPPTPDAGAGGAIFPGCGRGHRSVPILAASEEGEVSDQIRPTSSSPEGYEQQEWVGSWKGRVGGGCLMAGRRCSWGRGAVEGNGEGAEPPGTAGVRGPLRPKGRCFFGPQTSSFSLGSFMLCRRSSLKRNSKFLCLFILSGKCNNTKNLWYFIGVSCPGGKVRM